MKQSMSIMFMFIATICLADSPIYEDNLLDALALSEDSDKEILVIFTADWCKYCNIMKNDLKELDNELKDKIVCFVDVDKNSYIKQEYRVGSIPDYFILKNKIETNRQKGYFGKNKFIKWLEKNE